MAQSATAPASGLQFIVEQVGETYGIEQAILRAEQQMADRTHDADFRAHLERFIAEDHQHIENLRQVLRMMIGTEANAQGSIDRGQRFADAILGASQDTIYHFVQGLLLIVFQTTVYGRIFMQIQQCVENREIIGLLETNHHEDEAHYAYLESQVIRAAEELSGLIKR
ncbi:MAG TPA: DUF892 family protein [Chloroflexota bacterium]|jgi:rubrerythrin|nr:DUF892 family protein [Chloroflexota bacterium]